MVLYRRPPDGQWARTGTVDSSIVRFLLPIGGAALLRLPWRLPFHIKIQAVKKIQALIPQGVAQKQMTFLFILTI